MLLNFFSAVPMQNLLEKHLQKINEFTKAKTSEPQAAAKYKRGQFKLKETNKKTQDKFIFVQT